VQVLAANRGSVAEPFPLGHRQPVIPPLGAVFMVSATTAEVEEWLGRAPDDSRDRRDLYRARLDTVREWGYSLLAAEPRLLGRQQAALSAFEQSDRLPRHEHAVREATSELAELFCPDLLPGELYDVASIVAHIPTDGGVAPMAIRMTGLPGSASAEQIESWVDKLKRVAAIAGGAMADTRG
jgi:DNA-binding IclR family transcriptional regulator